MTTIPVYSSRSFVWSGSFGTADESTLIKVGSVSAPDGWAGVAVESGRTGHIRLFNPVEDPSQNNYDGEFMIYSFKDEVFVKIWNY
jgi:hypothetical protein